ncbi:MAG: hypothetical protein CMO01_13890 [Thalassobius sp.]|nr:hypothetical protein [Thalassovita sp.]
MNSIYYFLPILILTSLLGSRNITNSNGVCVLDKIATVSNLEANSVIVSRESDLYTHVNKINQALNQTYSNYQIRKLDNDCRAKSYIENGQENRVLALNDEYYISRVDGENQKQAVLYFVLAHEMQHHINGDPYYPNSPSTMRFINELRADETAGYVIGKLTDTENLDINFFRDVLPRILSEENDSNSHPPIELRIIVCQIGWLKAKCENNDCSTTMVKRSFETGNSLSVFTLSDSLESEAGLIMYDNRNYYYGEKRQDVRHGNGIFVRFEGNKPSIYIGEWKDDKRHGKGKSYDIDDEIIYKGQWENDKKNGKGILLKINGEKYDGYWKDDKRHGKGKYHKPNKEIYEGEWLNDKKDGKGILRMYNGYQYNGKWKNDLKHGWGHEFLNSGFKYSGFWLEGFKNGHGILYLNGDIYKSGCWENGYYVSKDCENKN